MRSPWARIKPQPHACKTQWPPRPTNDPSTHLARLRAPPRTRSAQTKRAQSANAENAHQQQASNCRHDHGPATFARDRPQRLTHRRIGSDLALSLKSCAARCITCITCAMCITRITHGTHHGRCFRKRAECNMPCAAKQTHDTWSLAKLTPHGTHTHAHIIEHTSVLCMSSFSFSPNALNGARRNAESSRQICSLRLHPMVAWSLFRGFACHN